MSLDDVADVLRLTMSPTELILRGSLMYWFLFLVLRFILARDVGSMGVTDFLFVVLLGDAAQNSMIGNGTSFADGATLIGTLVVWNYSLDWLSCRYKLVDRFVSPPRICLVRDGRMLRRQMRREYITSAEVMEKLREKGHTQLTEVKRMYLESDGEISLITAKSE
jgi:uncharacterized membrane protein YcaP (DUF421 family)